MVTTRLQSAAPKVCSSANELPIVRLLACLSKGLTQICLVRTGATQTSHRKICQKRIEIVAVREKIFFRRNHTAGG
jgi:hypothetical protein